MVWKYGNISVTALSLYEASRNFVDKRQELTVIFVEFPVKIVTNDGSFEVNKESKNSGRLPARVAVGCVLGIVKTCLLS